MPVPSAFERPLTSHARSSVNFLRVWLLVMMMMMMLANPVMAKAAAVTLSVVNQALPQCLPQL